jgi:Glycosyl hydrolases family 35/Beta-galactosidase, domain 2/Beta-galactosidase second all-beta domain
MTHSRRRFLKSALAAPLGAALGPEVARLFALAPQDQGSELFPNPHLIRYDANCFTIRETDALIYSAAFHYARCPQPLWRDRLSKLKAAGYNTITTYVFWNYHEPVEGRADTTEFEAFIQLVKEMGFWMIARPGPYACAEWDSGGLPRYVVAKGFPLRSNDPESIRTSQHWFDIILPVIARHQISHAGPIIMMQIENEYDFWPKLPDADRKAYIQALAEMAWNGGIDVPLITCWTKQARENSDPAMARIMDTCNFYPRWKIQEEVPPRLQKLRQEEPASPLGVTELQGGWFSQFGGKLSVDQEGVDAVQYNLLAKTAIEQGVTYFGTYMGFGGTNFDWAAKGLTTTYDYAAPLREPGGLWDKFYAAHGIGATLSALGEVLARAKLAESGVNGTNPNVTVTLRENGERGTVFVRENANAEQRFKMTFPDPASPTRRPISVPREGELLLGPREMKMLPVQLAIPGGALRYSTAELLATGEVQEKQYLILYDEPGRLVEVGLATRDEPHIEGDAVYQYWDPELESVVFGVRVEKTEKMLMLNNHLVVILLPRETALQTWTADFPQTVVPGPLVSTDEKTPPISVPIMSDTALISQSGAEVRKNILWAELLYRPGEHSLTMVVPPVPSKCLVDGARANLEYDRHWHTAKTHVSTPAIPVGETALSRVATWTENFDPKSGKWAQIAPSAAGKFRSLDEFAPLPYGYVKYRAEFSASDASGKMFITTFDDDGKKVFINGKPVPEASAAKTEVEFPLAGYVRSGSNLVEIAYELFGGYNFGEKMQNLKGIESVRYGADTQTAAPISNWQIQLFPAPMGGRELDPQLSTRNWKSAALDEIISSGDLVPAFTWCRAEFGLASPPEGWWIPWKLRFEAGRDALLYLNGKFVGRYVTEGPQKDFYLPEPYLIFDDKRQNELTVVLAYTDDPRHIRTLRVAPYEEFALRRTRLELKW